MAETTNIPWCDATQHPRGSKAAVTPQLKAEYVDDFVARLAERYAITNVKPKLWVRGERQNMVGIELSALGIAAMHADELVTREYVAAPSFVFKRGPFSATLHALAINVTRSSGASARTCAANFTHLLTRFKRVLYTRSTLITLVCCGNGSLRGISVLAPLEGRGLSFSALPDLHPPAIEAASVPTIGAAAVVPKKRSWLPSLAACAAVFAPRNPRSILFDRNTCVFRGNLQSAFGGLCHGSY